MIEFHQGKEIAKVSDDEIDQEGICWALSMKWLKIALEGQSDNNGRIDMLRNSIKEAIELQRYYAKLHRLVDSSESINPGVVKAGAFVQWFGARLGLKIDRSDKQNTMKTSLSPDDLDEIVEQILTPGTGHMLSFQWSDKGHAMATRTRSSGFWYTFGNEVFLFDPNEGEANLSGKGLKFFLRNYMKDTKAKSLLIIKVAKI